MKKSEGRAGTRRSREEVGRGPCSPAGKGPLSGSQPPNKYWIVVQRDISNRLHITKSFIQMDTYPVSRLPIQGTGPDGAVIKYFLTAQLSIFYFTVSEN